MPSRFQARRYLSGRMLSLAAIGFAAGLPSAYMLLGGTLQKWLLDLQYDVKKVTLFAWVTLPLAFNFVWAPLLDRFLPPVLGRRRGWLLIFQLALVLGIVTMALVGPDAPGQSLLPLVLAGLAVAFFVASHDVVADAYRTDLLEPAERGAGAAVFVIGYRIGMLVAGGGALLLADHLPWRSVYLVLAAFMGVGLWGTLTGKEPEEPLGRPRSLAEAIVEPVVEFVRRLGWSALGIALFVALYKLPDALGNAMTVPMLTRGLGYGNEEIAWVRNFAGLGAMMTGALVGGPLVARLGLRRSLWTFGIAQAVTNLGMAGLAATGPRFGLYVGVTLVENFTQGLATAGFIAAIMALCDRRYSATQYALFTSLMFAVGTSVGAQSGFLIEAAGFAGAFVWSAAAGIPGLLLLLALPRLDGVETSHGGAP